MKRFGDKWGQLARFFWYALDFGLYCSKILQAQALIERNEYNNAMRSCETCTSYYTQDGMTEKYPVSENIFDPPYWYNSSTKSLPLNHLPTLFGDPCFE